MGTIKNFQGKVMSISLTENCVKNGVSVELHCEAELYMGECTYLSDVFNFMKNLKRIQSALGKSVKTGSHCRLTIYVGIYTMKDGQIATLNTVYNDLWSYEGIPQYDNEGADKLCVYLTPDERYTRETRDLLFPINGSLDDLISEIGSVGRLED